MRWVVLLNPAAVLTCQEGETEASSYDVVLLQGSRVLALLRLSELDVAGVLPTPSAKEVTAALKRYVRSTYGETVEDGTLLLLDLQREYSVMPGLLDGAVYATVTDDSLLRPLCEPPSAIVHSLQVKEALEATLRAGFTTVRDAGGADRSIREAIDSGYINGPHLLLSGSVLCPTGGLAEDLKAGSIGAPPALVCDGPAACIAATRAVIKSGADCVKLSSGGGILAEGLEVSFTEEELKAITSTARAAGRRVFAHVHRRADISRCVLAGVHVIEGGSLAGAEEITLMDLNGVSMLPCVSVLAGLAASPLDYLTADLKESVVAAGDEVRVAMRRVLRASHSRALCVASGSGAMSTGMHGLNGGELLLKWEWSKDVDVREFQLTPLEVIHAATRTTAAVLGLTDRGVLAAGKLADVLIVRGNPASELELLTMASNIVAVFKAGELVKEDAAFMASCLAAVEGEPAAAGGGRAASLAPVPSPLHHHHLHRPRSFDKKGRGGGAGGGSA